MENKRFQLVTKRIVDIYGKHYLPDEYKTYYASFDSWTSSKDFAMTFDNLEDVNAWWKAYVSTLAFDRSKRTHMTEFDLRHVEVRDAETWQVIAVLDRCER